MDIINLNGVEYVKKDKLEVLEKEKLEAEKQLQLIKDAIGKSLTDLQDLMNSNVLHMNESGVLKKNPGSIKDTDVFSICESYKIPYQIKLMNDIGQFFSKTNRQLKFTIKHVLKIQEQYYSSMTVAEARELREELKLSPFLFGTIIYNLQEGTFDKYIQQFTDKQLPKVNRNFKMPIENNVEKRKESGYY